MGVKMAWEVIQNRLQSTALKPFSHVELTVNDMHIIANRRKGLWSVKILHEKKDTHTGKLLNTNELIEYLNAYITTARTQIKLLRE